jgi:hypothetical protein
MPTEERKLSDRLTITVNDQPTEIFMSGGLIRRLAAYTTFEDVAGIYGDYQVQEILIIEALSPRSQRGVPLEELNIDKFNISMTEAEKLIEWIVEHITDFFINSVEQALKFQERNLPALQKIQAKAESMQSLTGLKDSQELKPSAGHTTADTATST